MKTRVNDPDDHGSETPAGLVSPDPVSRVRGEAEPEDETVLDSLHAIARALGRGPATVAAEAGNSADGRRMHAAARLLEHEDRPDAA